jgi:hypothetical protein
VRGSLGSNRRTVKTIDFDLFYITHYGNGKIEIHEQLSFKTPLGFLDDGVGTFGWMWRIWSWDGTREWKNHSGRTADGGCYGGFQSR